MKNKVTEEDLLAAFVDEMEARGHHRKIVRISVDEKMLATINDARKSKISLDELHKLTDRCLANSWLEHKVMGGGNYHQLGLTTTGFGVVQSRRRSDERRKNRSWPKRASDYIERSRYTGGFLVG